jgi:hypothetical protein
MKNQKVYLRVGLNGSGHTRFIQDLGKMCGLKCFNKKIRTPLKTFHRRSTQFEKAIGLYEGEKMVAFDNTPAKQMCNLRTFKNLNGGCLTCDSIRNGIDTWVFSVNQSGMKSSGDIDIDDILVHVFGKDELQGRRNIFYRNITEVHHMLADGTVRVLACDGKKLEDAIVLSYNECIKRVVGIHTGVVGM